MGENKIKLGQRVHDGKLNAEWFEEVRLEVISE